MPKAKPPAPRNVSKSRLERQDLYFVIYASLGPDRSLRKVVEMCKGTYAEISFATLQSYSREFNWVERVKLLPSPTDAIWRRGIDQALQAARRHVSGGLALQQLALMGVTSKLPSPGGKLDSDALSGGEIARLFQVGTKAEREAISTQQEHVQTADVAATFIYERLPPVIVRLLDQLHLSGDVRALAVGFLASEMDEFIRDLYAAFRVEPPEQFVEEPPLDEAEVMQLPATDAV
ncbi:MAG: hypothetical protein WC211_12640 [Dehalococcoidia bacterium]